MSEFQQKDVFSYVLAFWSLTFPPDNGRASGI